MPTDDLLSDLYEQLLAASRRACAAGHYAVAYHALAAAMHCAIDLEDAERLASVEAMATEQREWVDTTAPADPLSTQSSAARGGQNLWASLTHQAHARRQLIFAAEVIEGAAAAHEPPANQV